MHIHNQTWSSSLKDFLCIPNSEIIFISMHILTHTQTHKEYTSLSPHKVFVSFQPSTPLVASVNHNGEQYNLESLPSGLASVNYAIIVAGMRTHRIRQSNGMPPSFSFAGLLPSTLFLPQLCFDRRTHQTFYLSISSIAAQSWNMHRHSFSL